MIFHIFHRNHSFHHHPNIFLQILARNIFALNAYWDLNLFDKPLFSHSFAIIIEHLLRHEHQFIPLVSLEQQFSKIELPLHTVMLMLVAHTSECLLFDLILKVVFRLILLLLLLFLVIHKGNLRRLGILLTVNIIELCEVNLVSHAVVPVFDHFYSFLSANRQYFA